MGSIRVRIAVVHSTVLFGLAALVVGATYLALALTAGDDRPEGVVTGGIVEQQFVAEDIGTVERGADGDALATMRIVSFGALGVLFVASLGIGWVVVGRTLAPIDRIARAARETEATALSHRIALEGPDSELKRLADAFDAMLARLDGAFEAQRQFLADASHDLRNPLAIIQANLDVALSGPDPSPETLREHASVIRRASERMTGIVGDLLALTRLEEPKTLRQRLNLAALADEVADELAALADRRGISLERDLEPNLHVVGDRGDLKRAMVNLLDNALAHAPEASRVEIGARGGDGWVYATVVDQGPGIPPEVQHRIFDRFYRVDRTRGGSGLGLAIVRQIAEAHGGSVRVTSIPGIGTCFELRLPAAATIRPDQAGSSPLGAIPRSFQ